MKDILGPSIVVLARRRRQKAAFSQCLGSKAVFSDLRTTAPDPSNVAGLWKPRRQGLPAADTPNAFDTTATVYINDPTEKSNMPETSGLEPHAIPASTTVIRPFKIMHLSRTSMSIQARRPITNGKTETQRHERRQASRQPDTYTGSKATRINEPS